MAAVRVIGRDQSLVALEGPGGRAAGRAQSRG